MKKLWLGLFIIMILVASCAGQKGKVIFHPGSEYNGGQTAKQETWQIIEAQNPYEIPEWVSIYLEGKVLENGYRQIESLDQFSGKYVFIGESRGDNINILKQWANGYSTVQDLPRLIAPRVERRLVAAASLYPDDEYGEYFVSMIRKVSDGEYYGALKELSFWVKRQLVPNEDDDEDDDEFPQTDIPLVTERYEYFVLISVDREALQKQLREIMSNVRLSVSVTREQAAAIARVQNTFFEGF